MKIAIIGAGFTGLSLAEYLEKNDEIAIFEADTMVGGLARGFKEKEWDWNADCLVHHWFSTDKHIYELAKRIGIEDKIFITSTKSSCFYNGQITELDSPLSLLKFPFLNFFDRLRTGIVMAYFRLQNNWKIYERTTSYSIIKKLMGKDSFNVIWRPLFNGKFGKYADKINGAWIWGRIHPRTKKLAYFKGGFQKFAENIREHLEHRGVKVILNSPVKTIKKLNNGKYEVYFKSSKTIFDKIVFTIPPQEIMKIAKFLRQELIHAPNIPYLSCQYLVLESRKSLLDKTYWLNINDSGFPFMLVAEHTNLAPRSKYGNNHIIYLGKYLEKSDPLMKLSKKDLICKIPPYLAKIKKDFKKEDIIRCNCFRFQYAQPIFPFNYSKKMIPIKTRFKGVYISNMNNIYPWDRGTNNAVALAKKTAVIIKQDI